MPVKSEGARTGQTTTLLPCGRFYVNDGLTSCGW